MDSNKVSETTIKFITALKEKDSEAFYELLDNESQKEVEIVGKKESLIQFSQTLDSDIKNLVVWDDYQYLNQCNTKASIKLQDSKLRTNDYIKLFLTFEDNQWKVNISEIIKNDPINY